MGVAVYWLIVAAVAVLGMVMPQHGRRRGYYVAVMATLHAFVCGFRYQYLTGDLIKYSTGFFESRNHDYFSGEIINKGINTGFFWFQKFIAECSDGDFQVFLLVIAVIVEIAVAVLVFKYSPSPWISFLVWNCMGFYVFGFSAIKQALAMAVVMLAMNAILEERPRQFLLLASLAGLIHFPAFAFLPAYWIAKSRIKPFTILCYIIAAILIFIFQNPIVTFVTSMYYEEGELMLVDEAALGGRFFMMVVILVMGILLKGFGDRKFEQLFHIMVVAAIFQMFSGFDNIFTRFADYYFQFSILFLPMMVSSTATDPQLGGTHSQAVFPFNKRSLRVIAVLMAVYLIWYYNRTCLDQTIAYEVDNYLNFRFMWEVK